MIVILSEAKDLVLSLSDAKGVTFLVRFREAHSQSIVNLNRVDALKLRARSFASLRMTSALGFTASTGQHDYPRRPA